MKRKEFLGKILNKPIADLERDLREYKDNLWTMQTDLAAGKVKNIKGIQRARRDIARILTMLKKQK